MRRLVIGSLLSLSLFGCDGGPGFNGKLHLVALEKKSVALDDVKAEIDLPTGIVANSEQTVKSRAWWGAPKADGTKADITVRIAARGGAGLRMTTRAEASDLIKESKGKTNAASDEFFFLSGWTSSDRLVSVRQFEAGEGRTPLYCDVSISYDGVELDAAMKTAHVAYADKICASLTMK